LILLIKKNLKNYKYEIIFVDDNSTDNTQIVIGDYISKIEITYLEKIEKYLQI
jgi:glycosyltransferase involved in cell wall biosynthesis